MSFFEFWFRQYHCLLFILSAIPLGMEDGSIADEQVTASSNFNGRNPWNGRLNNTNGHWAAGRNDATPWIQVAFSSAVTITAIQAQGAAFGLTQWVEELQIQTGDSESSLSYIMNEGVIAVSI